MTKQDIINRAKGIVQRGWTTAKKQSDLVEIISVKIVDGVRVITWVHHYGMRKITKTTNHPL